MPLATIVGGSIGGLFSGVFLRAQGWDVDILERADNDLSSRGTGIARHLELEKIIRDAGVSSEDAVGIFVTGRDGFDEEGNIFASHEFTQQLGAWNWVFQPLFEDFPKDKYHIGCEFSGLSQSGESVLVKTHNGREFKSDLVVGADGFRSTVRSQVAPEVHPQYGGYVAWRGVSDESMLSESFRAQIFRRYAFLFPHHGQLIGYPMAGEISTTVPGNRRYNYLWYSPASAKKLKDILTGSDGRTYDFAIPPPLLRDEIMEELNREAERYLPLLFKEAVHKAHTTVVQPIYDVDSTKMVFGRVTLIGDAAFVARPHVGIGVLKAAQDAHSLAVHLRTHASIDRALALFEADRLSASKKAVQHGRLLGSFIEQGLTLPENDPDLDLTRERLIRVSGRPYEHIAEFSLW